MSLEKIIKKGRNVLLTGLIAIMPMINACKGDSSTEPIEQCLDANANVNYEADAPTDIFYNPSRLHRITNEPSIDGYKINDLDPYRLKLCSSMKIYRGHAGGEGDTFEITDKDEKVLIACKNDNIHSFTFSNRWTGKINGSDLRIGDTPEKFIEKYPDAKTIEENGDLKAVYVRRVGPHKHIHRIGHTSIDSDCCFPPTPPHDLYCPKSIYVLIGSVDNDTNKIYKYTIKTKDQVCEIGCDFGE